MAVFTTWETSLRPPFAGKPCTICTWVETYEPSVGWLNLFGMLLWKHENWWLASQRQTYPSFKLALGFSSHGSGTEAADCHQLERQFCCPSRGLACAEWGRFHFFEASTFPPCHYQVDLPWLQKEKLVFVSRQQNDFFGGFGACWNFGKEATAAEGGKCCRRFVWLRRQESQKETEEGAGAYTITFCWNQFAQWWWIFVSDVAS